MSLGFPTTVGQDPTIRHIPKFGGEIWFVNGVSGSDSNDGKTPDKAFATLGTAISACSAGDAITVMAGTYTETGLDLNVNNVEVWCELGTIIAPASGTAFTISGNYCFLGCDRGAIRINPAANQTGLLVTGNFCYGKEIRVAAASSADIGFDFQGDGLDFRRCRCSDPLVASFKIQGDKVKLEQCCTGGTPANTSYGYWITNSCDKTRLINCGSQGHSNGGFYIDAGCTNEVIWNFSSGGGDGKCRDIGSSAVISNLTYEEEKYATQTFTGVGGASDNLFKVTGTVEIKKIFGHVTTVLAGDVGNLNLEFDDGAASVNLTTAVSVNNAPVGSLLLKDDTATNPLLLKSSANAGIIEQPAGFFTGQQPIVPFILVAKNGATNYITSDYSGNGASGVIHWHVVWQPITDDGYVEIV